MNNFECNFSQDSQDSRNEIFNNLQKNDEDLDLSNSKWVIPSASSSKLLYLKKNKKFVEDLIKEYKKDSNSFIESQDHNKNDQILQDIKSYMKIRENQIQQQFQDELDIYLNKLKTEYKLNYELQIKWRNVKLMLKALITINAKIKIKKIFGTQINKNNIKNIIKFDLTNVNNFKQNFRLLNHRNLLLRTKKKIKKLYYFSIKLNIEFIKSNLQLLNFVCMSIIQVYLLSFVQIQIYKVSLDIFVFFFNIILEHEQFKDKIYFILNIILTFPYSIIIYFFQNQYFENDFIYNALLGSQWIILFKIYHLRSQIRGKTIIEKLTKYLRISISNQQMLSITITTLIFCHFCSCYWIFLHELYHQQILSWISIADYDHKLELYIQSFYLVIQTVSTVGYGDNTPSNDFEIIFSIIVMTVGAILFSYFIVSTINYKLNFNQYSEKKLQYKMIIMEVFCQSTNVSKHLRERIIEALEYNHQKVIINENEQYQFLNEMSQEMKIKIIKNIKQINSKQIFFKNKNDLFVFDTIQLLQPLQIKQKQPIFKKNQYPNNIYLIQQGTVALMTDDFLCFKEYIQNSYFGDVEILKNMSLKEKGYQNYYLTSYKALAKFDCDLYTISEIQFINLLKIYPNYLSSFKMIAKQKQQYIEHNLKKIQIYKFLSPNSNFWKLQYNVEMLQQPKNQNQQLINKRQLKKAKNKQLIKQSDTFQQRIRKEELRAKSLKFIPVNTINKKIRSKSNTLIKTKSKVDKTYIPLPQIDEITQKMKDFQKQVTKKIFQVQLQQQLQNKQFQKQKNGAKTEKFQDQINILNFFDDCESQSSDSNNSLNKIDIKIKKENLAYELIKQNNEKFDQLYEKLKKYQQFVQKFEKTKQILEINFEKIVKNN